MLHTRKINGTSISFDCGCKHPELENNSCPTGSGDCASCQYGKAEISIKDLLYLIDEAMKGRES